MELRSVERRKRDLLAAFLREFAALSLRSDELAAEIAGFTGVAAERLAHGELHGSYEVVPALVSEAPNMRRVARRINASIDALVDGKRGREHAGAREQLHVIFESFGVGLFDQACLYHVGVNRALVLRGEFNEWKARA